MTGVVIGRILREKYLPDEGRIASLAFTYSPQEVDQLRGGRITAPGLAILNSKRKRLARRDFKAALFGAALVVPLFGIIALSADIPTARKWAIFLLGFGFCALIVAMGFVTRWFSHGRHAHPSKLRTYRAPAIKQPDGQTVRFGKATSAPHWVFSFSDARTITEGAEYEVFHVHNVLIYLEEITDPSDPASVPG